MAIVRLPSQDAFGTSTTNTVTATYTSTPTQNNLLIATLYHNTAVGAAALVGWTLAQEMAAVVNGTVGIWYKIAGIAESTSVIPVTASATVMRLGVYEYTGNVTTSVLDTANNFPSVATSTTLPSGDVTTTDANDLIVGAWGFNGNTSGWIVDSGFSLLQTNNRMTAADRVVSSTGTYGANLTWTTTQRAVAVIAAFKAAPTVASSAQFMPYKPSFLS